MWAGTLVDGPRRDESVLKSAPPVWAGTRRGQDFPDYDHYLNPPRPCGRGQLAPVKRCHGMILKSAPPVWAGTALLSVAAGSSSLKSAPPVWAGTYSSIDIPQNILLKSAPPVWAGTLNTLETVDLTELLKSAPPVWAGTILQG